jgi:Dolichyl-phosphate-mannose-protein mannosyltransferase
LFGPTEFGTRFPEVFAYWVFCVCIYRFVSIRANAVAGFIALLFPLTCTAYWYASEARPHGIVVGFFGLALLAWQSLSNGTRYRRSALPLLLVSLSAAALCHCYAFLLFIPLALGELTRTILRRKIDFAFWGVMAFSAVVVVLTVLPLRQAVSSTYGAYTVTSRQSPQSSWGLASNPQLAIFVFMLLVGLAVWPKMRSRLYDDAREWRFSGPEIAVMFGTLFVPVFAFAVAVAGHSPLYARYSLVATGAVAALTGAALARMNATGLLSLLFLMTQFAAGSIAFRAADVVTEPSSYTDVATRVSGEMAKYDWIESAATGGDPIVLYHHLNFAPLLHYAPASLRPRFAFWIPEGRFAFLGEIYGRLEKCCAAKGNLFSKSEFIARQRRFFVFGGSMDMFTLTQEFAGEGIDVTVARCVASECLFHVHLGPVTD